MKKSIGLILGTVLLDGVGIGLIFPILPGLVREMTGAARAPEHFGMLMALYAVMQFFCSPVLGALSDRFGRRPVLLVSLAGAALDYVMMFFAPNLFVLYVGRMVAGITGANMAVATAYIADVTGEKDRAKAYGYMNACFGLGIVVGPAIGGVAGMASVRMPFLIAAVLNGVNLLMGWLALPESHAARGKAIEPGVLNPFKFFKFMRMFKGLLILFTVFFLLHFIGQVPGSLWVLYVEDRFKWTTAMVGVSFAAFGILHAGVQAFLTGPATARLGEVRVLLLGMLMDCTGFLLLGFATAGWMVFPIIPFLCLGGIAMPALQTLLSKRVTENHQGELQGILVSLMSMAAIVGPLVFTRIYSATTGVWLGTVWVLGAGLYVVCLPVLGVLRRELKKGEVVDVEEEAVVS